MSLPTLEQFETIVANILSPDNAVRGQAEQYYAQTKQNPDYCVSSLLKLLRSSQRPEVRSLCCVLLRKCISRSGEESIFDKLSPQMQAQTKNELIQAVLDEKTEHIRHKLVYALSGFIAGVSDVPAAQAELTEFFKQLFQWTKSPTPEHRESAFDIFNQLATHMLDKGLQPFLPLLKETLRIGLEDPASGKVRLAALECTCSIVLVLNKGNRQAYSELVPFMLQVLARSLNDRDFQGASTAIEAFIEIAVSHPAFFKNNAPQVIAAMFTVAKSGDHVEDNCRHLAMEYMVSMAENMPNLVKKISTFVDNLFPLCLQMMLSMDDDMDDWVQSFEDDDTELTDYDVGLESLDRISLSLGGELVQPIAFKYIPQFLGNADWKHRVAGLMSIAQTAEGCTEEYEAHLKDLVGFALRLFKDEHPRVRYAAIHCTAQLCTDFCGAIQEQFHSVLVPALLGAMDDPIAKVQAHGATAVVNFVEDCDASYVKPYLDGLLGKLLLLLKGGQRYVQEQTLSAISAIADTVEEGFVKYYDYIMPLLKEILLKATGKGDRMLRARAIECVSLIAIAVGKEKFGPDAKVIMDLLSSNHSGQPGALNLDADDPQAHHIMQAWSRIARCLEHDFIPYLSYVMPPLLASASREPDVKVTDADDETEPEEGMESVMLSIKGVGDKRISIRTSILEEKAHACSMIYSYASELHDGFYQFVEPTAKVMVPLLKFAYLEDIRETAANTMPELLVAVKMAAEKGLASPDMVKQLLDFVWKTLIEAIKIEPETATSTVLIESISQCVQAVGADCLNTAQLEQITALIKELFTQSISRREELKTDHKEEYEDDEEEDDYEEELMMEEDFLSSLGELIGALLKTHPTTFVPYFLNVLYPIYGNMVSPQCSDDDRRVALCVMCDFVEHGKGAANNYITQILPAMLQYAGSDVPEVRQAAVFGLGALGQHGNEIINSAALQIVQALVTAIQEPKAKEQEFRAATCNAVSALFKFAAHRGNIEGVNAPQLLNVWLAALPVSGDIIEAQIVHKHFLTMLGEGSPIILGANFANIKQILRVLAMIHNQEVVDDETHPKIRECLQKLQATVPGAILQAAWAELSDNERLKLQEIVSSG